MSRTVLGGRRREAFRDGEPGSASVVDEGVAATVPLATGTVLDAIAFRCRVHLR